MKNTTATTRAVISTTELSRCMEAIQHDILQHAMEDALEYFGELEMPYLGKAHTCERALLDNGIGQAVLSRLDLALSRFVSVIAWHVYRQGLKDAMQKPSLAEALLKHTAEGEPPPMLDLPHLLDIYDLYAPDNDAEDAACYHLKRPEDFKAAPI